ncbi:outer membrane beta-barrel protein [Luteolibacter algae]|uniref:Outer membrane beta-barrel protein n=1 Tax=Luteolibacter algae TaxID=454151 RepID=A0ABW5D878_9BACT
MASSRIIPRTVFASSSSHIGMLAPCHRAAGYLLILSLGLPPLPLLAAAKDFTEPDLPEMMWDPLPVQRPNPFVWPLPEPLPLVYRAPRRNVDRKSFPAFDTSTSVAGSPFSKNEDEPWSPASVNPIAPPDGIPVNGTPAGLAFMEKAVGDGIILGEVSDATTLNPIAGALVEIPGTGRTVETDAQGRFEISGLPAGTFNIEASQLGYFTDTTVVTVIESSPSEIRFGLRVKPTDDSANEFTLEEETVVGEYQGESGGDLFLDLNTGGTLSSGLSKDDFSTSAVSDAADAVSKISGANIIGGKYAVVRGLADRYSNTLVNGAVVSSADPSRKAVQLDLFPSDLLDSLSIQKTFTPDLPADFAGGTVLIETLKIPEERILELSVGAKFKDSLDGDFYVPGGQRLDYWGDGAREFSSAIGERGGSNNPNPFPSGVSTGASSNQTVSPAQKLAKEQWSLLHSNGSFIPQKAKHQDLYDYSVTYADSLDFGNDMKLGWVFALTREQSADAERDVAVSRLTSVNGPLELDLNQTENRYTESVDWGSLISGTFQLNKNNVINYTRFTNRSAENEVNRIRNIQSLRTDGPAIFDPTNYRYNYLGASGLASRSSDITSYTDRTLEINQFSGSHAITDSKERDRVRVSWLLSDSIAEELRPDVRTLRFTTVDFADPRLQGIIAGAPNNPGPYNPDLGTIDTLSNLIGGNPPNPQRQSFSTIDEGENSRVDIELPFYFDDEVDSKRSFTLKAGLNNSERTRESRGDNYAYFIGTNRPPSSVDLDVLFRDLYNNFDSLQWIIGASRPGRGEDPYAAISISDTSALGTLILNSDTGVEVEAHYLSGDFQWDEWNVFGGARVEKATRSYNAQILNASGVNLNNPTQVSTIGQTDIVSNEVYPSLGLSRTFGDSDEFSLTAAWSRTVARPTFLEFAPIITEDQATGDELRGNPSLKDSEIENIDISLSWNPEPKTVVGLSVFNKNLTNPITKVLGQKAAGGFFVSYENAESGSIQGIELEADHVLSENWRLSGNLTYLASQLNPGITTIPIFAESFEGQPNWIFNLNLGYSLPDERFTANLIYNLTGEYLSAVSGSSSVPSVVRDASNTLDLVLRKSFEAPWGDNTVTFKVTNLLDDSISFSYEGSGANYSNYSPGRTFTVSLSSEF